MDDNCIFCKIIKGEIPAKKVYEDDIMIAILDIHPAAKGHVLIIPKEHQPILPLIAFDKQQHLFKKTKGIAQAVKEAVLCNNISIFVANGGAAGQQSPHFLYHIIPREEGDMLEALNLPNTGSIEENENIVNQGRERLGMMMQAYLQETGRMLVAAEQTNNSTQETEKRIPSMVADNSKQNTENSSVVIEPSFTDVKEAGEARLDELIKMINDNEDLKEALMFRPEEVKQAVITIPKWQELFKGIDIDELSNNLKIMYAAKKKETESSIQSLNSTPNVPSASDLDKISKIV